MAQPHATLRRRHSAVLRSTLAGSLRPDPDIGADWRELPAQLLLRAALTHGVAPALHLALRGQPDVPPALAEPLQEVYRNQLFQHLRTLTELRALAQVLDATGLGWVAMKGPILAETLWSRPDLRMYSDLDIVVQPDRLGDALDGLEVAGAELVDRNWRMIRNQMRAELTLTLPHGTVLDLHWHVVNEAPLRSVFRFPIQQMLGRAVRATLPTGEVPVFDPIDTALHLAYHTVHSGAHKLVWFKDFSVALAAPGLDGAELVHRAREQGCELLLALTLRRTEELFGRVESLTARPRRFLWTAVCEATSRYRPVPQPPDVRFSGQIVYDNARDTTFASLRSTVLDSVRSRAPRDWSQANPLHQDVPDPQARADYLAEVATCV